MSRYRDVDYAAYRTFVEGLVDDAMRAARDDGEEITAGDLARRVEVAFDTELVDEMVQTRILEVLTGSHGRTVRQATRGWSR